jgi:hypothetical protein
MVLSHLVYIFLLLDVELDSVPGSIILKSETIQNLSSLNMFKCTRISSSSRDSMPFLLRQMMILLVSYIR